MVTIEQVNEWARLSCPKWNKNKLSRRHYRAKYRNAAKEYWESPEGQRITEFYKYDGYLGTGTNTYPWPYREPDFANWAEDGSDDGYNLISDQSGCVIKYATSYCAWKIFEATGTWPQKTSSERLDAKRWLQFLAEAGYAKVVNHPTNNHHYVGINPDEGEWGIVVWFECDDIFTLKPNILVSSYINKKYQIWYANSDDYT
ncbi:hypothetical protein IKF89_00405 [Candidatus Saccharibacteria bacterium]|nr:hypothetical protein [Candidatus Saccharibacteria bacterium]